MMAAALCVLSAICSDAASEDPSDDSKSFQGLWSGTWGGGERDGVVFQPVIAELFIEGDHVELGGFRNVNRISGTIRVDASAGQIRIARSEEGGGQPKRNAFLYTYELKGDELTLVDSSGTPIALQRIEVVKDPMGNAGVKLVTATGINDAGDLLVTEYTELRVGRSGAAYFKPVNRSLNTKQAVVGVVQKSGLRKITVDDARKRIQEPTVVVILYKRDDLSFPKQTHELWKESAAPNVDSEAVWRTLSQTLRPGTLVFLLAPPKLPPP
jgi:hypothetical protein